jgi:serine protease Do
VSTAFAAGPVQRLRASVVHLRANGSGGAAGIVWRGGAIVTNAHVATARRLDVVLPDGSAVEGETVWRDPERDVAVVVAPGLAAVEPAEPADSAGLRPGTMVFAMGHPWGVRDAVSVGVFHRIGPVPPGFGLPERLRRRAWVQAAVRLAPGNSGGPLADPVGRVIGVSAMIAGGLALAIPSDEIDALWRRAAG